MLIASLCDVESSAPVYSLSITGRGTFGPLEPRTSGTCMYSLQLQSLASALEHLHHNEGIRSIRCRRIVSADNQSECERLWQMGLCYRSAMRSVEFCGHCCMISSYPLNVTSMMIAQYDV